MVRALVVFLVIVCALPVFARDRAQVREFRKYNPCPITQQTKGACPGYVVDHIIPLCAGGADRPFNMQWQEKQEALAKDKTEWALCRWIRKANKEENKPLRIPNDAESKGD